MTVENEVNGSAVPRGRRRRRRHGRPEVATFLSFLWPGFGQVYAGRAFLGLLFALPILLAVAFAGAAFLQERQLLAFRMFQPGVALAIALAIVAAGLWRLGSMVHANAAAGGSEAFRGRPIVVLAVLAIVVVGVHLAAARVAWSFHDNAPRIFTANPFQNEAPLVDPTARPTLPPGASLAPGATLPPGATPIPIPSEDLPPESPLAEPPPSSGPAEPLAPETDRINILITGLDSAPGRTHELTDTLIVVSVDRQTSQVAMVSFPRDIASFPLSDGRTYRGKINSLLTYARQNQDQFANPPLATLAREVGHLIGIRVDHYAAINIEGFRRLIDTVGGVTVENERQISDPSLGFFLPAGTHHLDGEEALQYVRSRKGVGDSDFTRAARQQQILIGLRSKLTDPSMLPRLPEILDALAGTITTNYPPDRLADTISLGQSVDASAIQRHVLGPPYSWHPPTSETNGSWELRLDLDRVQQLSIELFGDDSRYAQLTTGAP